MTAEEKQRRLKAYSQLITRNAGEAAFESMGAGPGQMAEWVSAADASEEEREVAQSALRMLSLDQAMTRREMETMEAIILPTGRPALTIANGRYSQPPNPWTKLDRDPYRRLLEAAIPAIGRVEIPDHPSIPYAGTGFLVGDGLMMTNRHVAELFVLGLGKRELRFRSDVEMAGIDFRRELHSDSIEFFEVKNVLMVHPYWDMALFEITGLSPSRKPLTLEAVPPEDLEGVEVAVIGYPAQDPRNDIDLQNRIFGGKYRVKRLQPGQVRGARETRSFGHSVNALTHDSSTLGGNSGSAVINIETGHVIGLHFGGVYLDANLAVPSYALSCDHYVVDANLNFTESNAGKATWMNYWESEGGITMADDKLAPPAGSVEITIPLKLTLSFGTPILGGAPTVVIAAPDPGEAQAYYDAAKDKQARTKYYTGINPSLSPGKLYDALNALLEQTHKTRPGYSPSKWVYPVVDRQKNGKIRSLYSAAGNSFTFEEMVAMDEAVELRRRDRLIELVSTEGMSTEEAAEAVEAALPFNCEHVVPQSWFAKKEPMRGDIHHLFGCESGCNSFRGNHAFFSFTTEAFRTDCGQAEKNKFEPGAGKGAAARATLYFLVRYPKKIDNPAEFPASRLRTLLDWHQKDPVSEWEKHRNQSIFAIQGNRNPFIDFPEWAEKVDFRKGLQGGGNESFEDEYRSIESAGL